MINKLLEIEEDRVNKIETKMGKCFGIVMNRLPNDVQKWAFENIRWSSLDVQHVYGCATKMTKPWHLNFYTKILRLNKENILSIMAHEIAHAYLDKDDNEKCFSIDKEIELDKEVNDLIIKWGFQPLQEFWDEKNYVQ